MSFSISFFFLVFVLTFELTMHPQRRFSVYNSKHKDVHNHAYMGAGNGGTMI